MKAGRQVGGQAVGQASGFRVVETITWVFVYEMRRSMFISSFFYLLSFFAVPHLDYPLSNYIWKGQCRQGACWMCAA